MKRTIFTALMAFAFGIGLTLLASTGAMAIHKGAGNLACGGCHTMHASQGGSSAISVAGGNLKLLRGTGTIHALCLVCHAETGSGNNVTQPPQNVFAPTVWKTAVQTPIAWFDNIGAGGDFRTELGASITGDAADATSTGYGHSLVAAATVLTPPGKAAGDGTITGFTCTNCHDPHGAASGGSAAINGYRNLKKAPAGAGTAGTYSSVDLAGAAWSWVGGINGGNFVGRNNAAADIWPIFKTNTAATNVNVYGTGSVASGSISKWCATCHDTWHETDTIANGPVAGGGGRDWRRHPVETAAVADAWQSSSGTSVVNITTYTDLPTLKSTAVVTATDLFYGTGATRMVFCLSCHFAHAGPYYDALRWDYLSTVGSGTQTGNGIASTVGCQQCHNR